MLITYTSIVHVTQAGFLSGNTIYLAHLYYVIFQIGKNLTFETFKKESKNWIKFFNA